MSSQDTDRSTLGDQQAAIAALFSIASAAPRLPASYISIHTFAPVELGVTARTLDQFEEWRQELKLDPNAVELVSEPEGAWLRVAGYAGGTKVNLTGHFVLATRTTAVTA